MFLLMDAVPNEGNAERSKSSTETSIVSSDGDSSTTSWQHSSFLRQAYTKARSMTGASMASTDASSVSSSNGDTLDGRETAGTGDAEAFFSKSSRRSYSDQQKPESSSVSEDTFYECQSQAGSRTSLACLLSDDQKSQPTCIPPVNREDEIATYANGLCVYEDGTPAKVAPPGHCISKVSYDFEEFYDFDLKKARKNWDAMLKWREESEVWKIHTQPNVRFDICKQYFPSAYHGVDRENSTVVEYSYPGQMRPEKLFDKPGAMDEVLHHHVFMQEYLFNCLYTEDKETWRQIGKPPLTIDPSVETTRGIFMVMDVKDCGINVLKGDVFTFVKRMIHISTSYYPAMAKRLLLINSPFWVSGVFQTIKPLLPECFPVEIVSAKNTLSALREYIDDDQIPVEYGGSSRYPLHGHPLELRLFQKVEEAANYGCKEICTNLETKESQDETVDTGTSLSYNSNDDGNLPAKDFVLLAATEIEFDDHSRINMICENMEDEHISSVWQLQHLETTEWRSLGFPLGLASAVRRKLERSKLGQASNPYADEDDNSIQGGDLLDVTPRRPRFDIFRGFQGCCR